MLGISLVRRYPQVKEYGDRLKSPGTPWEIAIIGGGPAGSSLAAILAQAGRRVVVFEREKFPRDKLCGEFLSGESRRFLDELGCMDTVMRLSPAAIHRCRITSPSGASFTVDLPAPALGVSRRLLDDILLRHAESSGAEVREETRVCGIEEPSRPDSPIVVAANARRGESTIDTRIEAHLVVGAYGRREGLDRFLGRPFLRKRHPYVGLKRHHRPAPGAAGARVFAALDGVVEVHAFQGGYCGLSRVEDGVVNVCMLVTEGFLRNLSSPRWECVRDSLCGANRTLGTRLDDLEPMDDTLHAVAGVPFSYKERSNGSVLFVGDAAGMIAPFCGDGQAMAFRSSRLLADLVLKVGRGEHHEDRRRLQTRWDRVWRREFGVRMRLGRWLQPLLLRRATANVTVRMADKLPSIARWLVRATRGQAGAAHGR